MNRNDRWTRPPGLGVGEDAGEFWMRRLEEGTARLCPDCGGVLAHTSLRSIGREFHVGPEPHCTDESRRRMTHRARA